MMDWTAQGTGDREGDTRSLAVGYDEQLPSFPLYGMHWRIDDRWLDPQPDGTLVSPVFRRIWNAYLRPMRVNLVRYHVDVMAWELGEGDHPESNARTLDRLVAYCRFAREQGVRLVPILMGTGRYSRGKEVAFAAKVRSLLRAFARRLVATADLDLYRHIALVQIEDEMNHPVRHAWWPKAVYVEMLKDGCQAVYEIEAEMGLPVHVQTMVIFPADLMFVRDLVRRPHTYFRAMRTQHCYELDLPYDLRAFLACPYVDVIGVDVYPGLYAPFGSPQIVFEMLKQLCSLHGTGTESNKRFLLAEIGYATWPGGRRREPAQLRFFAETFRLLSAYYWQQGGREHGFYGLIWYCFNDQHIRAILWPPQEYRFGVLKTIPRNHWFATDPSDPKLVWHWLAHHVLSFEDSQRLVEAESMGRSLFALDSLRDPDRQIGERTALRGTSQGVEPTKVLIVLASLGGCHHTVASALSDALYHEAGDANNLTVEVLDAFARPCAQFPLTLIPLLYRLFTAGRAWPWRLLYRATEAPHRFHMAEALAQPALQRGLRRELARRRPDIVVSVFPALGDSIRRALHSSGVSAPLVSVVVDLVTVHFAWIGQECKRYVVATEEAARALIERGIDPARVQTFGLPVAAHRNTAGDNRCEVRRRLGMLDKRPLVLFMGGGEGSGALESMVKATGSSCPEAQLVVLAGRNQAVRERLLASRLVEHCLVFGYIPNVSEWMRAADLLVTKAGPATVTEAMAAGLPLIVTESLPQEAGTIHYLVQHGAARSAPTPAEVASEVRSLLDSPAELDVLRAAISELYRDDAAAATARLILQVADWSEPALLAAQGEI